MSKYTQTAIDRKFGRVPIVDKKTKETKYITVRREKPIPAEPDPHYSMKLMKNGLYKMFPTKKEVYMPITRKSRSGIVYTKYKRTLVNV